MHLPEVELKAQRVEVWQSAAMRVEQEGAHDLSALFHKQVESEEQPAAEM